MTVMELISIISLVLTSFGLGYTLGRKSKEE